ncbi:hypothetical protein [Mesorhizobium sp. LNHC221B00]|uniref:hypothetical protein n=2 Tax=Phyllobacteriaceae TaxID=69277 RepID=UPI0012EBA58A|nr:hypothetical protein [Mesorhizobium sp. LNHC221B00]
MDDISQFGALLVTLVIGIEPVLEPDAYLVERSSRERVMDHDIVPLQLLYQEFGALNPTRYRLECEEIRLKLDGIDFAVILDKVDATEPPKYPAILTDLELYFGRPLNAALPLLCYERPKLIQVMALNADYECGGVHAMKLPCREQPGKRPLAKFRTKPGKNFCGPNN